MNVVFNVPRNRLICTTRLHREDPRRSSIRFITARIPKVRIRNHSCDEAKDLLWGDSRIELANRSLESVVRRRDCEGYLCTTPGSCPRNSSYCHMTQRHSHRLGLPFNSIEEITRKLHRKLRRAREINTSLSITLQCMSWMFQRALYTQHYSC